MNTLCRGMVVEAATLVLGVGDASAQIKWDLPNEYAATSIFGEGDIFFANLLKEKSKGQILVTNHFGGSLGYKSKDHFDAVADGAVPLADYRKMVGS
ncbi:MAG: hypothetical protein EXQ96_03995 [Alphaproteobacteria bacterium]|nr:hypothetical protein [Alphaproteobacteria bacterium]